MQKFGYTVLFILVTSISAFTQNNAYYTVLVGTFLDAKAQDFENLRSLGFLHATKLEGNLTQVYIGGFDKQRDAEKMASAVRSKGYSGAFVQERLLSEGRSTAIIQMGIRNIKKNIDWEDYYRAGDLYVILNGNQIKIVTGLYNDINDAKKDVSRVRKLGFKDAFVKRMNTTLLHQVNSFEAGGLKRPLFDITIEDNPQKNRSTPYDVVPKNYDDVRSKSPVAKDPSLPSRIPNSFGTDSALPTIRSKVKRRSALELQKVLKVQGTYSSSLDGYYGKGTTAAYEKTLMRNRDLQKYLVLSQYMNSSGQTSSDGTLQNIINNLIDDPSAPASLEKYNLPIANVYKAYLLFTTIGPNAEVNDLMNTAIRKAYQGKKIKNQPPFNYNATYAYEDLEQLILHVHYVHSAPDTDIAAPCWLFQMHPRETTNAYKAYNNFDSDHFQLQACDEFMYWPEVKLVQTIASDLNPDPKINQGDIAQAASERARLFLSPSKLSNSELKKLTKWNAKIWDNINSWAARDALHQRLVTAFKIAYFQSQVRLEDYYMNKGFKSKEAEGLALATLQTIAGPHLARFD